MKLADFAEYDVCISGRWTDYHGQRRYLGALQHGAAPVRLVSVVASSDGFSYAKSGRLYTEDFEIDLLLQPIHRGDAFQVVLRTGNALNTDGRLDKSRRIEISDRFAFKTGSLADWAAPDPFGPTIRLLALSVEDLKIKRNGIWGVKPKHLALLPKPWVPVLTKTRKGHVVP